MLAWQTDEWLRCDGDPAYFINTYAQIKDGPTWIPFALWPAQARSIDLIHRHDLVCILKARQVGFTWLVLAYGLWGMLFKPAYEFLIFSVTEREAVSLLDERLKGMYARLPWWMHAAAITNDSKTKWILSNGSVARAFPTDTGDSYTGDLALLDEADLNKDLKSSVERILPVVEEHGKLVMISRVDKRRTLTYFKETYKDGRAGKNGYATAFIAWYEHPGRDAAWYAQKKRMLDQDELDAQYPETDDDALRRGAVGKIFPRFTYATNVSFGADYVEGYPIIWVCDPGYVNPLCILMVQERPFKGMPDHLCIFNEVYVTQTTTYDAYVIGLDHYPYPPPSDLIYDPENPLAAADMGKLRNERQFLCKITMADKRSKSELIKAVRRYVGPDPNDRRLLRVHPRCEHTIEQMLDYHTPKEARAGKGGDPKPAADQEDHAVDCVQYLMTGRLNFMLE